MESVADFRQPWEEAYSTFWSNFEPCFKTRSTRHRAQSYVRGLLGTVERKNSWQLAEFLGDSEPYGIQQLLYRASWDVEKTRDELILAAKEYLLKAEEKGVLVVDETGFLKKGKHSAGVKRQYSGTAGRIENSQIGVFLALVGSLGQTLIDRELYLPKEWCEDPERMQAAKIPVNIGFHTKQQLAQSMLERAFSLGISPEWVLADAAYGDDSKFRRFLQEHNQPYIVAISSNQRIWHEYKQIRVDSFLKQFDDSAWCSCSAGNGSKGKRLYDWICIMYKERDEYGMCNYLLSRRKLHEGKIDIAYYFCYAKNDLHLDKLVEAVGKRWNIECCFETAKQEVGLDEYEVRSWQGWYRHITLSMIGLLLLNIFKSLGTGFGEKKEGNGRGKQS